MLLEVGTEREVEVLVVKVLLGLGLETTIEVLDDFIDVEVVDVVQGVVVCLLASSALTKANKPSTSN